MGLVTWAGPGALRATPGFVSIGSAERGQSSPAQVVGRGPGCDREASCDLASAEWPETPFSYQFKALPSPTPEGIWAEPAKGLHQEASTTPARHEREQRSWQDSGRKGVSSLSPCLGSSARADRGSRPSAGASALAKAGRRHWDSAPGWGFNREGMELLSPLPRVQSQPCCPQRGKERSQRDTLWPQGRSLDRGSGSTHPIPATSAPPPEGTPVAVSHRPAELSSLGSGRPQRWKPFS